MGLNVFNQLGGGVCGWDIVTGAATSLPQALQQLQCTPLYCIGLALALQILCEYLGCLLPLLPLLLLLFCLQVALRALTCWLLQMCLCTSGSCCLCCRRQQQLQRTGGLLSRLGRCHLHYIACAPATAHMQSTQLWWFDRRRFCWKSSLYASRLCRTLHA